MSSNTGKIFLGFCHALSCDVKFLVQLQCKTGKSLNLSVIYMLERD